MPADITLDDLAAMIAADRHGRRYETSPDGALSVVPAGSYETTARMPLAWLLQTSPTDHLPATD